MVDIDADVKMSILRSSIEETISLILTKKNKLKQLPLFRGIFFKEETAVEYQLIFTGSYNLNDIPPNEWLLYAQSSAQNNLKLSKETGTINDGATHIYTLIVFENKDNVVFALVSTQHSEESFVCTTPKNILEQRSVFLDVDWQKNSEYAMLLHDTTTQYMYH